MIKKLNVFVDETGEFGYEEKSSILYGVSFVFHEQNDSISYDLTKLNDRLNRIGYTNMIHMADLVMRRGEYSNFDFNVRKAIFTAIYQFSRKVPVKYCTLFIDKRYTTTKKTLKNQLFIEINKMLKINKEYFNKFDKIVMYYDNGQEELGTILCNSFSIFDNFEHIINFDHKEKRLFQVADMLTFIDKYDYKYKNKLSFTKGEKYFFSTEEIRKILKELNKKRFSK